MTFNNFRSAIYCTYIDNPVTINGNQNLADVVKFSNKSNVDHYVFLYRLTKVEKGIRNKDLFKKISYLITDPNLLMIEEPNRYYPIDIKNLKKVGVMTLEDSWLDSCTLKRKGASCEEDEKAVFDTIPIELADRGCETINYNIYDLFYLCDYNDSIFASGYSGPIKNYTKTSKFTAKNIILEIKTTQNTSKTSKSTSSSKSSTLETATTIISVSEKKLFNSKSFIILSIGIPVLIMLAVFPLVHYYLVTKSKLKVKSESSSGFSDYTHSTNDTSSSEISDKDNSDSTSK